MTSRSPSNSPSPIRKYWRGKKCYKPGEIPDNLTGSEWTANILQVHHRNHDPSENDESNPLFWQERPENQRQKLTFIITLGLDLAVLINKGYRKY